MQLEIIPYDTTLSTELDEFTEMIHSLELKYNSWHLLQAGIEPTAIHSAIEKAMHVCNLNGIDTDHHFRPFYIFNEEKATTYCDWRMTRQGFYLVLLNSPAETIQLAKWQWGLANLNLPL